MKLKFGAIVVDGRNKIGGHVLAKNRAGSYMRTKVTPVNPRSTYQSNVRARLSTISSGWRSLQPSEIIAWNASVDQWKRSDIFGDLRKPSGFNLYQRLNNNILLVGGALITTPPVPVGFSPFSNLSINTIDTGNFQPTWDTSGLNFDEYVVISVTPPLSSGISYSRGFYRIIDTSYQLYEGGADILSSYSSNFGSPTQIGSKIFIKIWIVNIITGQSSTPLITSNFITPP